MQARKKDKKVTLQEPLDQDVTDDLLVITPSGKVERSQFRVSISWRNCLPRFRVTRRVISTTLVHTLVHRLLRRIQTKLTDKIRQRMTEIHVERFRRDTEKTLVDLAHNLYAPGAKDLVEELIATANEVASNKALVERATRLINDCTDAVLRKFKEDVFQRGIVEIITTLIQRSRGVLLSEMQVAIQSVQNKGDKPSSQSSTWKVLPDGTKLLLNRGDTTAVVIEQKPQVRTMNIKGVTYHLGFPYVVFLLIFKESPSQVSYLQKLCVFFSNETMTNPYIKLRRANFSNIDTDGRVHFCRYERPPDSKITLTEQTENALAAFWQARFTGNICSDHRRDGKILYDGSPASLLKWERLTLQDPRFVLKVDWPTMLTTLNQDIENELSTCSMHGVNTEKSFNLTLNALEEAACAQVEAYCREIPIEKQFSSTIGSELGKALQILNAQKIERLRASLSPEQTTHQVSLLQLSLIKKLIRDIFRPIETRLVRPDEVTTLIDDIDIVDLLNGKRKV